MGDTDEAARHAQRSRTLQLRYHDRPGPEDTLLVARIDALRGQLEGARASIAWLRERFTEAELAPSARVLLRAVELAVTTGSPGDDGGERAWDDVIAEARRAAVLGEELLEVLVQAATAAARRGDRRVAGRRLEEALAAADPSSPWRARLSRLRAELT